MQFPHRDDKLDLRGRERREENLHVKERTKKEKKKRNVTGSNKAAHTMTDSGKKEGWMERRNEFVQLLLLLSLSSSSTLPLFFFYSPSLLAVMVPLAAVRVDRT